MRHGGGAAPAMLLLLALVALFSSQVEAQTALAPGDVPTTVTLSVATPASFTAPVTGDEARFVVEVCDPGATVTLRVANSESDLATTAWVSIATQNGYASLAVPIEASMLYAEVSTNVDGVSVQVAMSVDASPQIAYSVAPTGIAGGTTELGARFESVVAISSVDVYVFDPTASIPLYSRCYFVTHGIDPSTSTFNVITNNTSSFEYSVTISPLQTNSSFDVVLVASDASGAVSITPVFSASTIAMADCYIPSDMSFCSFLTAAVYVPSSDSLVAKDQRALTAHSSFSAALDQFDCAHQKYSLIRTCSDCSEAYREWACAMEFPVCNTDPSTVGVSIVKPCETVCWDVRQSCPGFLSFECPDLGSPTSIATYQDCTSAASSLSQLTLFISSLVAAASAYAALI